MKKAILAGIVLSSALSSIANAAKADREQNRCHLKMDDQTRYEISLMGKGSSVETPIGKISIGENLLLTLDEDVVELKQGTGRASWSGNVNITNAANPEDKKKQEFVVLNATDLYLMKGTARGVLTCTYVNESVPNMAVGIQKVDKMPSFYNDENRAMTRIQTFYNNPLLAGVEGLDIKALILERETNFIEAVRGAIKTIDLRDEDKGLREALTQRMVLLGFKDAEEAAGVIGGGTYGTMKSEVSAQKSTDRGLEILVRSNYMRHETAPFRQYGMEISTEQLRDTNLMVTPLNILAKNELTEQVLKLELNKANQVVFSATEKKKIDGKAMIWGAQSYVQATTDFTAFLSDFNTRLQIYGEPLAEIAVPSQEIGEHKIKLTEKNTFSVLSAYLNSRFEKDRPNAEKTLQALKFSGIEKNPNASSAGIIRIALAEGLRVAAGLPSNTDERVNKAIEARLNQMIAKTKDKRSQVLSKIMFIDRQAFVNQIQRVIAKNLDIKKTDTAEVVMKKISEGLRLEKNSKRAQEDLLAWMAKQKVTLAGFCSWTGVSESPDAAKQGIKALLSIMMSADSEAKSSELTNLNQELGRLMIALAKN